MQLVVFMVTWLLALFSGIRSESLFDFQVLGPSGDLVSLSTYESAKVVIVVNVASNCGFTYTNYRDLQKLYDSYQKHGLEIIGFPSNQFGDQETGSNKEIQQFIKNYGITWPVMAKVEVNGPGTIELFRFLKERTGHTEITWNFNKFLVVDGVPVKRYTGNVAPKKMESDISRLLGLDGAEL